MPDLQRLPWKRTGANSFKASPGDDIGAAYVHFDHAGPPDSKWRWSVAWESRFLSAGAAADAPAAAAAATSAWWSAMAATADYVKPVPLVDPFMQARVDWNARFKDVLPRMTKAELRELLARYRMATWGELPSIEGSKEMDQYGWIKVTCAWQRRAG